MPTLAAPTARILGRGLFTDRPATLTLRPAAPGTGLLLVRAGAEPVRVHASNLASAPAHPAFATLPPRHTNLGSPAPFFTVEHLCSALVGLGVTDCLAELEGPELPILDGSAAPFANAIDAVGLDHTPAPEPIRLRAPVRVEQGGACVLLEPADAPSYAYTLDYGPSSPLPATTVSWDGSPDAYRRDIAPARTYCLRSEAELMRSFGLFTSLSPRDMLVLDDATGAPIDNALRFADEPAHHKLLDLIGDLALTGRPLCARVTAVRSGHALHHQAARAVLAAI
jgi:UDP-3-O-acyl N-acetylglucosamine deacetylase